MPKVHGLDGYKEARKILDNLDKVTKKKVVLSILRTASKPIVTDARSRIRSYSPTIAKAIKFAPFRRNKFVGGAIKPRGRDAWFAHFVEFGTSGIVKKPGGYKRSSDKPEFAWVGNIEKGRRYREDQQEKPFMRPAIDAKSDETKALITKGFTTEIDGIVKKYAKKV